jgi:glycine/D-amino acid oxidase-like deaminating enzyme
MIERHAEHLRIVSSPMSPPVNTVKSDERLPTTVDVVIVGGGIIGCLSAYYLALKGHSVAVIEKGYIACEQSSRNWGWCRQTGRDSRELPLIRESLILWAGLNEAVGADTGFRRTGLLYVTKDASELARWEEWLEKARDYQIESRLLSGLEAQGLMGGCEEVWAGGLHTASDGRAEPAMATPAIAEAARRLGVTFHQSCAARGLETEAGAVSGVVTEKGTLRTRAVLCAAGGWSSLLCRRHNVELPQLSVRASVLRTEPAALVADNPISAPGFGLRRRLDGGYTVGFRGHATFELIPDAFRYIRAFWPGYLQERQNIRVKLTGAFLDALLRPRNWPLDAVSPFERVRVLDPAPDQAVLDRALANLRAAYPVLRDVKVAERWAGMIDVTPDAIPVISPVESQPGFYLATGFSGHGFGIAPAAGRLAADLITGDTPLVDPSPFRYSRLIDGTRLVPQTGL